MDKTFKNSVLISDAHSLVSETLLLIKSANAPENIASDLAYSGAVFSLASEIINKMIEDKPAQLIH